MSSDGGGGGGGGGGGSSSSSSPPLDGGAFLLQLLRNPPQSNQHPLLHEETTPNQDPAVAAVGPTYPFAPHTFLRPPPQETFPRSAPPGFPQPFPASPPVPRHHHQYAAATGSSNFDSRARGPGNVDSNLVGSSGTTHWHNKTKNSMYLEHANHHYHSLNSGNHQRPAMAEQRRQSGAVPGHRTPAEWAPLKDRIKTNQREGNGQSSSSSSSSGLQRELLGRYGGGSNAHRTSHHQHNQHLHQSRGSMSMNYCLSEESNIERVLEQQPDDFGSTKEDDLHDQLEESLMLTEDATENTSARRSNSSRGKDVRIDLFRGHYVSSQRVRIRRRELECRYDIDSLTPLFLAIYKSLIPADEEKGKQKQLLLSLRKLVNKEWPNAQLHLYGSCANSFGVSNSDIDICLAIHDSNMSKSEILLKLADILQSGNVQNVQALTHARVPIVKMMDPVTGISCDICINNLLAVANTNLLRDYAQIDERLRQLAFIVKHWAKSREVNETYRGTLSSYAYVLMCIHFLQQCKPAILPCLQEMEATYVVNVDGTQCAYFDQVDRLRAFGAQNKESIARLLWGFFHYWAYYHDYANDVISVRTGRNISKRVKDWTRRIGNDRHLICIEDPFETSHDLGRVVDRNSIKILREEFERAADILQYDSNPSVTLFEPYVPRSLPNGLQSSD